MEDNKIQNQPRWYFAGLSSTFGVFVMHPMDSLKVQLQAQKNHDKGFIAMGKEAIRLGGLRGIFAGVDANVLRNMSATMARLGLYDAYKNNYGNGEKLSHLDSVIASTIGGVLGGIIGNPTDVVKVRMQNDMRLPYDMKRNYKNVFDGIGKVVKQEGISSLFRGVSMTCIKNSFGTLGQAAGYEECKYHLLKYEGFNDDMKTHILSGFGSGMILLTCSIPIDVVKTRLMNGSPNQYSGIISCIKDVSSCGLRSFYKGFVPSFIRIMPQNILLFVTKEKLTEHFGIKK